MAVISYYIMIYKLIQANVWMSLPRAPFGPSS